MQKIQQVLFLILVMTLISGDFLSAQGRKGTDPYAPGENIYKHYVGTIGKRKAVLDLVWGYQGGSNFGGSNFYFMDTSVVYNLSILQPATFDHGETLHAVVDMGENPWGTEQDDAGISIDFNIIENKLTGKYHNMLTGEVYDINLTEEYGKPIAFDMIIGSDAATITGNHGNAVTADIFTLGVTPAVKITNITEMDFINKQLLKFAQLENIQAEYIADFYKEYRVNFISASKIYFTRLFASGNIINPESPEYKSNLSRMLILRPVYNDTGFLVFKKYADNGKGREMTFLNLDMKTKKPLQLKDIVKKNPGWMSSLLESQFRKKYNLGTTVKLKDLLKVDRMPVTENIALTHDGIIFYYKQVDILKENMEPDLAISVYLTYKQLRPILKKEFADRIWP